MQPIQIKCSLRNTLGKESAAKVKQQNFIPAVVYGKGMENLHISLDPKQLQVRYESRKLFPTVVELDVDGKLVKACILSIDVDSVTGKIIHIDFSMPNVDGKVRAKFSVFHSGISGSELDRKGFTFLMIKRSVVVECKIDEINGPFILECSSFELNPLRKVSDLKLEGSMKIVSDRPDILLAKFLGSKKLKKQDEAAAAAPANAAASSPKPAVPKAAAKKK